MDFFALSSSFHAVPNTRPLSDRDDERGNSSDSDHDVVGVDVVDGVVTPPAAAWAARRRRERRFRPRRTTLHLASILAKVRGRRGLRVCLKLLVDEMAPRSLLFTLDACFFQSTHFSFPLFFIPPPFLSSLPPPQLPSPFLHHSSSRLQDEAGRLLSRAEPGLVSQLGQALAATSSESLRLHGHVPGLEPVDNDPTNIPRSSIPLLKQILLANSMAFKGEK